MFCLNDSTTFVYAYYLWYKCCKESNDENNILEDSKNTGNKVKSLVSQTLTLLIFP